MKRLILIGTCCFFLLPFSSAQLEIKKDKCIALDHSAFDDYFYKLDKSLFEKYYSENRSEMQCSHVGFCFFKAKGGNPIMAVQWGPDYLEMNIYFFYNGDIPSEIVNEYKALEINGKKLDNPSNFIKTNIKNAPQVPYKYFITKKGLKLGLTAEKVVNILGKPQSIETKYRTGNHKELIYKWKLFGSPAKEMLKNIPDDLVCSTLDAEYHFNINIVDGVVNKINWGYEEP